MVSVKGNDFQSGDIIAFYYNNKILVKRVIAEPGDWVDIDETGTVYVNNQELAEPYLEEKDMGDCNIDLPYQVRRTGSSSWGTTELRLWIREIRLWAVWRRSRS